MKNSIYILFSALLFSCSNLSPNKYQLKSTKENIECFELLIKEIKENNVFEKKLLKIRESKKGGFSPLTVKKNYRLIRLKEFQEYLPNIWKNKCYKQIVENRDLRGLRYINKDSIIIEIDQFERKTLSERYSRYGTYEIHRIITKKGIKEKSFRFPSERIMFLDTLENGMIYEISQKAKI